MPAVSDAVTALPTIRLVADGDWDHILALESQTYPSALSEDRAALSSKQHASPSTCLILETDTGIAGYVLSLPYPRFQYPSLAQAEKFIHHSRNLHLHDLVIGERYRGQGFAARLLHALTATAVIETYRWISLLAVAGSESFWRSQGFFPCPEIDLPENYGADAVYMTRNLADARPTRNRIRQLAKSLLRIDS